MFYGTKIILYIKPSEFNLNLYALNPSLRINPKLFSLRKIVEINEHLKTALMHGFESRPTFF